MEAIAKYNLDPSKCWMIGDHDKDIEFGRQLGMRTVKVSSEVSFSDAVEKILSMTE
ncbi:MAG: HAD hydrolase-like protein [Candidatus Methanomethylophilus sp.]|nr:HAD hydrolase-like protein [Methanomethylophilus sp.]